MEDKKTRTTKKIDLLTSVESIVYLAKGSKLNKEFYRKADKYLKFEFDTIFCHFLQFPSILFSQKLRQLSQTTLPFKPLSRFATVVRFVPRNHHPDLGGWFEPYN